jgi:hypothetical protein
MKNGLVTGDTLKQIPINTGKESECTERSVAPSSVVEEISGFRYLVGICGG